MNRSEGSSGSLLELVVPVSNLSVKSQPFFPGTQEGQAAAAAAASVSQPLNPAHFKIKSLEGLTQEDLVKIVKQSKLRVDSPEFVPPPRAVREGLTDVQRTQAASPTRSRLSPSAQHFTSLSSTLTPAAERASCKGSSSRTNTTPASALTEEWFSRKESSVGATPSAEEGTPRGALPSSGSRILSGHAAPSNLSSPGDTSLRRKTASPPSSTGRRPTCAAASAAGPPAAHANNGSNLGSRTGSESGVEPAQAPCWVREPPGCKIMSSFSDAEYVGLSQILSNSEFKLVPLKDVIPLENLVKMRLEDGIDPTRKEDYLSEEEFKNVFGCERSDFGKMATWKKLKIKKDRGLF